MNGKKAKLLRKAAKAISGDLPETDYQVVKKSVKNIVVSNPFKRLARTTDREGRKPSKKKEYMREMVIKVPVEVSTIALANCERAIYQGLKREYVSTRGNKCHKNG